MTRYQHLANLLAERIEQGLYRNGERLPSVRALSQEHGVSISTIQPGLSDSGKSPAHHPAAAIRLFCFATQSPASRARHDAPGTAPRRRDPVG